LSDFDNWPRQSWHRSERFVPRAVVQPVLRFVQLEAASGLILLVAATGAIVWANSPWHGTYDRFWQTPIEFRIGSVDLLESLALRTFVNEALLALFFVLAGLEIKRQVVLGELREFRKAALPIAGAIGGMIVPAVLYLAINAGGPGSRGWGATVATDVAFAVGVVALAGRRVPLAARIFILTLAVADDVGGIIVIAVFYGTGVRGWWLLGAVAPILVTVVLQKIDVRSHVPYVALAIISWFACRKAGIEAAIVGVIFGLLTPIRPFHDPLAFGTHARRLLYRIEASRDPDDETGQASMGELASFAAENSSPLARLESRLGPWIILVVMPLLAFANAGIRPSGAALNGRVVLGVVVGRVLGKVIGITLAVWLVMRLTRSPLPTGMSMTHLFGVATSGGIGFIVALFITNVAFTDPALVTSAKLGVLVAALLAGSLAFLILRLGSAAKSEPTPSLADQHESPDT
jgi:Na+:H+ antiporter, NhaA family